MKLFDEPGDNRWFEQTGGEAGINRARSIQASRWYRETTSDVFLMVDDDVVFDPEDANGIVDRCREGYDVIAAAYPTGDASHLAVRTLGETSLRFGPDVLPLEMRYVATGFFAVHRKVVDAMVRTLPLCHANTSWAFWPLFDFSVVDDEEAGGFNYLSEDYTFCDRARSLGFKVWLDMTISLDHLALQPLNIVNMSDVHHAVHGVPERV